MDKLLIFTPRPPKETPVSLAIASVPNKSTDVAIYDETIVANLKEWLLDGKTDAGFVSAPCGSGATTLIDLLIKELGIVPYHIHDTSKDFQSTLLDTNTMHCGLVVIDGFDYSIGKRAVTIVTDHVKSCAHKLICIGHHDRKSTSNSFAAKWKKFHFGPPKDLFSILAKISNGRVKDDVIKRIIRGAPTDTRYCINALEMHMVKTSNEVSTRDTFSDVIDAIEKVFHEKIPFGEMYKMFEHESIVIAGGVHENYLKSIRDIEDVARISNSMSESDLLLDLDFTNLMAFCASSTGFVNLCPNKKSIKVDKYGTVLSKNSQRLTTRKKILAYNLKRMEQKLPAMSPVDFGFGPEFGPKIKKIGR